MLPIENLLFLDDEREEEETEEELPEEDSWSEEDWERERHQNPDADELWHRHYREKIYREGYPS